MSLTLVIALNAVLDLAVIAGLAHVMLTPFRFARSTDAVPAADEQPLRLAA